MKCKTFDAIIKEISFSPEKSKKWLNDKRLTFFEKQIVIGHLMIRNNQNDEVIKTFESLTDSDIDFINAHRDLLLGICFNNLSNFKAAKQYLEKAITVFKQLQLDYHLYTANFNLFMVCSNQVDHLGMGQALKYMRSSSKQGILQQTRLMRCEFIFADETGDYAKACFWAKKIETILAQMSESDQIAHLVSEFMFYIRNDEFQNAMDTLSKMKKHRKFHLSENFKFMQRLLKNFMHNAPIYAYDHEFEKVPLLYHQLKVIQTLEMQELDTAAHHWLQLQAIAPLSHQQDFAYVGSKCLFSICLSKYKTKTQVLDIEPFKSGSKVDYLYEILQKAGAPLPKEQVFALIWGEQPQSKDDLMRLTRLISKVRSKFCVEIKSRMGTYLIDNDEELEDAS